MPCIRTKLLLAAVPLSLTVLLISCQKKNPVDTVSPSNSGSQAAATHTLNKPDPSKHPKDSTSLPPIQPMMFTIGGCYPQVQPYPEIRVDHYAPKPGKKLWIDFNITNPPGGYQHYRDYWGYSGGIAAPGNVDALLLLWDNSNLWYWLNKDNL